MVIETQYMTQTNLSTRPYPQYDVILKAVGDILEAFEESDRESLKMTPTRVADMLCNELLSGYFGFEEKLEEIFKVFENDAHYDEIIAVLNIPFYSMCEHHMLPFHGVAHVGYIPNQSESDQSVGIIGLSKIARLVDLLAHRLQVQERLTTEIASTLYDRLHAEGVMVVIRAEHLCMTARGINKPGSVTVTSCILGDFEAPETRAEFLELIKVGSSTWQK